MKSLLNLVQQWAPRILTQVCRDPNSETYGCFDRNWWHYKIRDFPSIILQQGSYFLWLLGQLEPWREQQDSLNRLARAGCLFWNKRAMLKGAFEEYYPWEKGYPPLAFSTLAVMKLAAAGVVDKAAVQAGARVAARQLLRRFEHQAANQQVAGLAAAAVLRSNFPDLISDKDFARLKQRTLALQYDEGWFEEYGGPDLGYLAVTIDCLWDLADATHDPDFVAAARRAMGFIAPLVRLMPGTSIGMHNSRNTDYLVPYGIARFAAEADAAGLEVLRHLFEKAGQPDHFLQATDDRYLCHYIGQSVARAALLDVDPPVPADAQQEEITFARSGYVLATTPVRALVSLKKGGIITALKDGQWVSDFGWVVVTDRGQFVNHWWSDRWTGSRDGNLISVRGRLVPHREHISAPLKHILLRAASYTIGQALIKRLKAKLIFQKAESPYSFERQIYLERNAIRIVDRITGLPANAKVVPAPRTSKRHVASADSFHPEDLDLTAGVQSRQTQRPAGGEFFAESTYVFA